MRLRGNGQTTTPPTTLHNVQGYLEYAQTNPSVSYTDYDYVRDEALDSSKFADLSGLERMALRELELAEQGAQNPSTVFGNTLVLRRLERIRGKTQYELKNFRGDLRQVVSDVKHRELDASGVVVYTANVLQVTDGYPFGWEIAERSLSTDLYRFGFNGKENDSEYGEQLIQDYGFRLYNPAAGKFLSVDPLSSEYPFYTPYQFAGNKPIRFIDLDGLEEADPPIFIFEGFGDNTHELQLKMASSFENMRQNGPPTVKAMINAIVNARDEKGKRIQITITPCLEYCLSPSVPIPDNLNDLIIRWPNSDVLERVAYKGEREGTWVADDFTSTFGNELKHIYDFVTGRVWTQDQILAAKVQGRADEIPRKKFITVPGTDEKLDVLELESNIITNQIRKWLGLPLEDAMTHVGGKRFDSTEQRDEFIKKAKAAAIVRETKKKLLREREAKNNNNTKPDDDEKE